MIENNFLIAVAIFLMGTIIVFLWSVRALIKTQHKENKVDHLHGSAKWADKNDMVKMGLLGNNAGVYIGAYEDSHNHNKIHYLRHNGPEHIIAFAPTRSGKGVGLVIPTLLSWPHSTFVFDIKGENWALTAGWRKACANNLVLKFDPTATDGSSICFNPMEEIRIGTDKEISDIQNIVQMIVDPEGKGLTDHWAKTGAAFLVAVLLHVLYIEKDKTLAGVSNFLSDPESSIVELLHTMLTSEHDPDGLRQWKDKPGTSTKTHPLVSASARDMLNKSENEMSGVLSTVISFLTLYRDPIIAKNTSYSGFKINDLMNHQNPVSLYVVVPPSDKDRLRPLVRLIINQMLRLLTESMSFEDGKSIARYKHRLLLMMDEFPSLGRLEILEESLAFIAGYGIKAYLITQDISQLWATYGKEESIFSNCHIRIAYAPNKIETAEILSKMAGTATIVRKKHTYSGKRISLLLGGVSTSIQEYQRPLLTPDEAMRLPGAIKDKFGNIIDYGDMLIFVSGHHAIYGKQILHFKDDAFSARAKINPPCNSDVIRLAPNKKCS